MTYFFEWQIKAGIIIALMVLVYVIFLSKDNLFKRNRFWMLSTLLIPWLMPFVAMPVWLKHLFYQPKASTEITSFIIQETGPQAYLEPVVQSWDWAMIGFGIYLILTLFFLVRMLWGYSIIYVLKRNALRSRYKGLRVNWLNDKEINPFSFYRSIFIPKAFKEKPTCHHILEHEKAHCKQWHSVDISLAEIVLLVQWWNPFAWWLRQLIAQNHEFCVDKAVMQTSSEPKHYQYSLMNFLPGSKGLKLVNNFSQSLIKKRIIMMNNSKQNNFLLHLKSISVAAVTLITLLAFTNPDKTEKEVKPKEITEINSTRDLQKFIASNIIYPAEARQNNIEGEVVANISVSNKGKIGQPKIGVAKSGDIVKIDEVVVVAYDWPDAKSESSSKSNELLDMEVESVLSKLPTIRDVNLHGKTVELKVKFVLQEGKKAIKKEPLLVLNKEVFHGDIKELDSVDIHSMNVIKGQAAIEKYGDKAKDGVVEIFTKEYAIKNGMPDIVPLESDGLKTRTVSVEGVGVASVATSGKAKDEVVVVGYGIKKKGDVNLFIKDKNKGKQPLFIVDGIEVDQEYVNNLNEDNIKSITVLKDRSASDLYGDKAKNGVVKIYTKHDSEKSLTTVVGYPSRNTLAYSKDTGSPIIIKDGEEYEGELQDIHPDDLKSMNILKGQAAIAKYGDKAKNGAIEIYTKGFEYKLKPDHKMDSVVVIGYGKYKSEDGEGSHFRIKGNLNGQEPVYYIDGEESDREEVDLLEKDGIEAISVLKDKSATDLYGDKGKNGVVLIETKK